MKVDFVDIAGIVEYVMNHAEEKSIEIENINQLTDYLHDNGDEYIKILGGSVRCLDGN